MGFLESLGFRKKRLTEGELFEALLAARRKGDKRHFDRLCCDHADVIDDAVPRWQKPPPAVTGDPAGLNEYIQVLGTAAELLRNSGHPRLWDALVGKPEDNPITVWEQKLQEANSLANDLRHDEAAALLMNHLIDARHLQGNGAVRLQALSQGLLGHVRYGSGKVDLAVGHYEQALRLCREQNDQEGIRVYLSSLYESQRYLGKRELAAGYAQELSEAWTAAGDSPLAKRLARLSRIVRDGEPLLRVIAHGDGKDMELDEVELKPTMKVEFRFRRNRPSLPGATRRLERGKELAGKLKHDDALELFREAAKVDPFDPDPHYQAGMVLCEQRLYPQAIEAWELCETSAPGWFFVRSDLWLARQLALGAMPHEVFLGLRYLQDGPPDAKDRLDLAVRMRSQAGAIPLFGLLYGTALQEAGRLNEAVQLWRQALKGEVEPDVRTRLLVSLSVVETDATRRLELLQDAVELNGNLIAAAGAALSLRFGK